MENPWGLTKLEAEAIDALCRHGCYKGAAREIGVNVDRIYLRMRSVREKMPNGPSRMLCILTWDRWRRSHAAHGDAA